MDIHININMPILSPPDFRQDLPKKAFTPQVANGAQLCSSTDRCVCQNLYPCEKWIGFGL